MEEFISLTLYLSVIVFCLLVLKNKKDSFLKGKANLFSAFIFAQSLYIIPPVFDQIFALENEKLFLTELVFYTSICTLFLLSGSLIGLKTLSFKRENNELVNNFSPATLKIIFYMIFFIGIFLCIFYLILLFNLSREDPLLFIGAVGQLEYGEQTGNFRKFQAWIMAALAGVSITLVYFSKENKKLTYLFLFFFFLVCLSLLLRGNRNFLLFILAPVLIFYLNKINFFNIRNTLFLFFGFLFLGQIIDIVRAVGIFYIADIPLDVFAKGISAGEFGQTARSFDFYMKGEFLKSYIYGKSYIIDPILNLATTLGFPFEVLSYKLAVAMSKDQLFGFGFSHQLESLVNFGFFGPIVYLFFGYFIILFDNLKSKSSFFYILSLYFYALIINMQRIDFAVIIKLAAIPISIILFVFFVSKLRVSNNY